MDTVDATCVNCGVEMRWQAGTPRLCGTCTARLKRFAQPIITPQRKRTTITDPEGAAPSPATRLTAKK